MILFRKTVFGLNIAFWTTFIGSSIPKAFPAAALTFAIHLFLFYGLTKDQLEPLLVDHPYAIGAIVTLISFLIIYRANQAYGRFSTGAEWLFHMESKLMDATQQVLSFHAQRPEGPSRNFQNEIIHLSSLVYALCALNLRRDDAHAHLIPSNIYGYNDAIKVQSIQSFSIDTSLFRPQSLYGTIMYSMKMRNNEGAEKYLRSYPLEVLGGLDTIELQLLDRCPNSLIKCNLVMAWLTEFIVRSEINGMLGGVPPPIVSRIFQELSDAKLGFNKARRINDIGFPFVVAQLTEFILLTLIILLPILNVSFVPDNGILGAFLSSAGCVGFIGLYEAARDIEDPFVFEPNDLPTRTMLENFNASLEMICRNPICPRDFSNGSTSTSTGMGMGSKDIHEVNKYDIDAASDDKGSTYLNKNTSNSMNGVTFVGSATRDNGTYNGTSHSKIEGCLESAVAAL
jgi:predicted membrane chloride channel (bestrophin family)